jgi:hypothetical protein
MFKRILLVSAILYAFHPTAHAQFLLKDQFPGLSFNSPIGLYYPNDNTDRICVIEQGGIIRIFPNDSSATSAKIFLDIQDSIVSGGELGLLGLAFHPQYGANGFFYVDYTRDNPLRTVISRFHVSASNADSADPSSEVILLEQLQPFENHNGGQLAFGPDGYLYIAFGDGGSGGDPFGNGQNTSTLLGKILRINVDSTMGLQQYAIPPGNPFYGDTAKKQEIFSYGMRNPWRFSFDGQTLWCGDVGQNVWEEIDTITNGGNYGWNIMEAAHCYEPPDGCDTTGLIFPIWEYSHGGGCNSVTGGFVYRGSLIPSLTGKYIYGDLCNGEIWTLTPGEPTVNSLLIGSSAIISSFGLDRHQEIYVCDYNSGKILKLSSTAPGPCTLITPPDNALNQPNLVTCSWTSSSGAAAYRLQVAFDSLFTSFVLNDGTITDTVHQVGPLPDSTLLFWRVCPLNGSQSGEFTPFRRFSTAQMSVDVHVMKRWNMISLPLDAVDGRKGIMFPSSVSNAFHYEAGDGYQVRDTLDHGFGYWLKFSDSAAIGIPGTPRYADTIDVVPGWNMIGSIAESIPVSQVSSIPGGMVTSQFFGYRGSYIATSAIDPGKGYWVKTNMAGQLILSSLVTAATGYIQIVPATELPPPVPDDSANGRTQSLPVEYFLKQNYPNPFNPATVIAYQLPLDSKVTLTIYNVLGQVVSSLKDELQEAGYKSAEWNASSFTSGVYFYRLEATGTVSPRKSFTQVKKMLLLK